MLTNACVFPHVMSNGFIVVAIEGMTIKIIQVNVNLRKQKESKLDISTCREEQNTTSYITKHCTLAPYDDGIGCCISYVFHIYCRCIYHPPLWCEFSCDFLCFVCLCSCSHSVHIYANHLCHGF